MIPKVIFNDEIIIKTLNIIHIECYPKKKKEKVKKQHKLVRKESTIIHRHTTAEFDF